MLLRINMVSKVFEQICKFLDDKEIKYGKDDDKERIYFGVSGLVKQSLLFIIEKEPKVVQFRSVQILDEEDLKNYHENEANRMKLYEYLLECNYTWKLGKFALDPEDTEVDLYFVVSDFVDVDKGIEEELIERVWGMIMGSSYAAGAVEKAIKDIKSILATGEKSTEDETDDIDIDTLLKLKTMLEKDPDISKTLSELESISSKPSKIDDLEDGI